MKDVVVVKKELAGVVQSMSVNDPELVDKVVNDFTPLAIEIKELSEELSALTLGSDDDIEPARKLARQYSTVCSNLEKRKKALKADVLQFGRVIDAIYNLCEKEARDKQGKAKEIADYFENQEKAKIAAIETERRTLLNQYEAAEPLGLGTMSEELWQNFLTGAKFAYEAKKKKEAEAAAEAAKQKLGMERMIIASEYKMFWDRETYPFADMTNEKFEACMVFLKKRKAEYEAEMSEIKQENASLKAQVAPPVDDALKPMSDQERMFHWIATFAIAMYPDVSEPYKEIAKEINSKFFALKEWAIFLVEHKTVSL